MVPPRPPAGVLRNRWRGHLGAGGRARRGGTWARAALPLRPGPRARRPGRTAPLGIPARPQRRAGSRVQPYSCLLSRPALATRTSSAGAERGRPGRGRGGCGTSGGAGCLPAQAAGTAIGLASPRSWRVPGARDARDGGQGSRGAGEGGAHSAREGAPGRRRRRSRDEGWRGGRIAVGQPRACGRLYPRAVLIKAPWGGKERLKWG